MLANILVVMSTKRYMLMMAVFLILITAVHTAMAVDCTESSVIIHSSMQMNPSVSGDIVVWQDFRNYNFDIYACDLSLYPSGCSGEEEQITGNSAQQSIPEISGNIIVWQDPRAGNADIYSYNLSDDTETALTSKTNAEQNPDIDGRYVVWEEETSVNVYSVIYRDLSTGSDIIVVSGLDKAPKPAISGTRIVWHEEPGSQYEIYLCDISLNGASGGCLESDQHTQVTSEAHNQMNPDIHNDIIIWQDDRYSSQFDIFMYNINTAITNRITDDSSPQTIPKVYGNLVVWEDDRNGNDDIYLCDLSAYPSGCTGGNDQQLTTNTANQQNPDIDADKIVWHDQRDGPYNIYMATCDVQVSDCGNGQIDSGEECDGSDFGEYGDGVGQCYAYDTQYSSGDLGCTSCSVDTSACVPGVCGDGIINTNEECDDDGVSDGDGCDSSCNTEEGYFCQGMPSVCSFTTWTPPKGINCPEFGIEQQAPPRPNPWTSPVPGYYYVDMDDPAATDAGNPYGTPSLTRLTMHSDLSPNSSVEVHGTYDYTKNGIIPVQGDGTASLPIFILGQNPSAMPVFLGGPLRPEGSYIIFENVELQTPFEVRATSEFGGGGEEPFDHIVLRHSLIHNFDGVGITVEDNTNDDVSIIRDAVIFNTTIEDLGTWTDTTEGNYDGIVVSHNSNRTWLLESTITHVQGDAIRITREDSGPLQIPPRYIYIGRNNLSENQENAIDIEESKDTIASENLLCSYSIL
jgi:beta propeller repeat protein/cysteine-rich repeat protein